MKTTRKVLSFIIALAFILSAFPMPVAFAEGEEYEEINVNDEKVITVDEELDGRKMFTFTAEKTSSYKIFSCNTDLDAKCTLYNSLMEQIDYADDTNNTDFVIEFDLNEGETVYIETSTYYRDEYGEYTVKLIEIEAITAIAFQQESVTGSLGDKKELTIEFEPEYGETGDIYWSVDDSGIVEIIEEYQTYCVIELVGEGEATVTATNDNGISASCKITVEAPQEILPEEVKEIVVTEENRGVNTFKFVSENGGRYEFYSFNNDFDTYGYIYNDKMEEIYHNDDDGDGNNFSITFTAEANTVYYLKARPYYSDVTEGKYSVKVSELVAAQDISFSDERIHGAIGSLVYNEIIFSPENAISETVTLEIDDESVAKIDSWWNGGRSLDIRLVGGGTTTLTATTESGLTATCEISVDEPTEISLGEEITESTEDDILNKTYKFVPEEDGVYKFDENVENASYSLNLWDSEFNHISSSSWMEVALTAGETYYYNIKAETASDEDYIEFSLVISHLVPATAITLSETEIKGKVATYETIDLEFLPENAIEEEITWTSSNEDAVIIYDTWNDGKTCEVKIVGKGSSVITAESESGLTASCTVTADQIVDVKVDETYTRYEEDGYSYTYMFQPEETGTYMFDFTYVNAGIEWIAMYDGNLSWLSKPYGDFQYEFTAGETYYLNPYAYVDYNSDEGDESYISLTVTKLAPATGIALSGSVTGREGKNVSLYAEFLPENAIKEDISWETSDDSIISIDEYYGQFDENVDLHLNKVGKATITATTQSGITASCEVTVTEVEEITVGEKALVKDSEGDFSFDDNYFKFIPETDGVYAFSIKGKNIWEKYIRVRSADGSLLCSGYETTCATLVGGQTYFCEGSALTEYSDETSSARILIEKKEPATSMEINREMVSGIKGEIIKLEVVFGPEGCAPEQVEWEIEDETIAYIESFYDDSCECEIVLLGVGSTEIIVTSDSGLTATVQIIVSDAPEIKLNEEKNVSETASSGSVAYKFVPEESGKYVFKSFDNDCDTYGYVFDENMKELNSDDDSGNNNNFIVSFTAVAGEVYYLSARKYNAADEGAYSVMVEKYIEATDIQLSVESISGKPGDRYDIYATLLPEDALQERVYWETSESSTVAIWDSYNNEEDGVYCEIKLLKEGSATITATTGSGLESSCTVTVQAVPEIFVGSKALVKGEGEYSADDNIFKFIPDESCSYSFSIVSENTYDEYIELWSADGNTNIDANGDMRVNLTGGEMYYIKASACIDDEELESSCALEIDKLEPPTSIALNPRSKDVLLGDEIYFELEFGPEGCGFEEYEIDVSNKDVIAIWGRGDSHFDAEAIGVGTATITVTTESGLTSSATITVKDIEVICVNEAKIISVDSNTSRISKFKFVPDEDSMYAFYSFNNDFDVYADIYDGYNEYLTGDDDSGEDMNFFAPFYGEAGETYYLKSVPNSSNTIGEYSVSVIKLEEATGLRLSRMSYAGEILDFLRLEASFSPSNSIGGDVSWSTSDSSVAKVSYSYNKAADIRLVGEGSAIITAETEDGLKATCVITSENPEEITLEDVLSLSYTNGRVEKTYMFIPEESGTYRFIFDGAVDNGGYSIYCEDDIDDSFSNGSGEFEAIAGKVYYITLNFWNNDADPSENYDVSIIKCSQAKTMSLSKSTVTKKICQGEVLSAIFGPDGSASEELEWVTSNEKVANILWSDSGKAEVMVVGAGTAIITATSASGLTATCVVTGQAPTEIKEEQEVSLSVSGEEGVEVYKFVPAKTGLYTIYSLQTNFTKSQVCLYNSDMEWEDMTNSVNDSFSLTINVTKGKTYYIMVTASSQSDTATATLKVASQVPATGISLMADSLTAYKYEEAYCAYQFEPIYATREDVEITTSNPGVVRIEDRQLCFVGIGIATITVTSESGFTDSCTITVTEPPLISAGVVTTVETLNSNRVKSFRFVPEKSGSYTFESTGTVDSFCTLYDAEFNKLSYDDNGNANNFVFSFYLEEGKTYYLTTGFYGEQGESYSFTVNEELLGDVNNDGELDIMDYQQVVNFAVSSPELVQEENNSNAFNLADINKDGVVDVLDAWKLSLIVNNQ